MSELIDNQTKRVEKVKVPQSEEVANEAAHRLMREVIWLKPVMEFPKEDEHRS